MATIKEIAATWNQHNTVNQPGEITLNASTTTLLLSENQQRTWMKFTNKGNQDIFIKLQPNATDNLKTNTPIVLPGGETWEMSGLHVYVGEVCGIAAFNGPGVNVGEMSG